MLAASSPSPSPTLHAHRPPPSSPGGASHGRPHANCHVGSRYQYHQQSSSPQRAAVSSPSTGPRPAISVASTPAPLATAGLSPLSKVLEAGESAPKRARLPPEVKIMPAQYELCDVKDLVLLISTMLMELVRLNDAIPLKDGSLTRFHSRAPPGISIHDYLTRLTNHATLSPPILLSMVYYIDRLCAFYPAFSISSLTVHRFLITAATVASKGLSDSFWTNATYARVGGVHLRELALLELEFLWRVEWRIVPRPEVLVDYYRSLVERSEGHIVEEGVIEGVKEGVVDGAMEDVQMAGVVAQSQAPHVQPAGP
ncbi:MAG: hypothetical protein M1829_004039 [Trizodia sp. TS-e1964]|nr:MAG: hypothetical protein M1829_004039 [Trizodia sp. TS-e1964]